jgi:putative tryptophan/tyrosine transport system substrate-binding protein
MRRRDFTIGLLLAGASWPVRAQEPVNQHRIAVIAAGPVARIHDPGVPAIRTFWDELRRWGHVEGENLKVDAYSGGGRPERYADLAREVVNRNPEVIVASTDAIARAARAASGTIPIVWIGGDPIAAGLAASLARPGGNITGVTVNAGDEIWGKRLQILKEAVPSASKIALLTTRTAAPSAATEQLLRDASRRLQISLLSMPVEQSTPSEVQRVFGQIEQERPDAIIVQSIGDLVAHRQLIVEFVEKIRLPAIYPWREYTDAGGLMAYASDDGELWRRMADDVHQILNGAKPGDIPIYQPTKFELLINLKAAKAIGLTFPRALLATADEVIE